MPLLPLAVRTAFKTAGKATGKNFLGIAEGSSKGAKAMTALGVGGAASILVPPIADSVRGGPLQRHIDEIRMQKGIGGGIGPTMQRTRELMMDNQAKLAALEPHTYAELVAGRKLSKGSRVYGYTPNNSAELQNVLYGMTTGQIGARQ